MNRSLETYKKVNIGTTNRGKIVVMLYAGGIKFLNIAKKAMIEQDYINKSKFLVKAQDVIHELNCALDMKKGKEISKNLRSIYQFLNKYLIEANVKNDPVMLDKTINILEQLKSAFEEIISNPEYQEAQVLNRREQVQHALGKYI